jgi:DNA-binding XRE family transcriptional regulator
VTVTPWQVKAARRLLGWTAVTLAKRVGAGEMAILGFEAGEPWPRQLDLGLVRDTIKSAGVEFLGGSIVLRNAGRA